VWRQGGLRVGRRWVGGGGGVCNFKRDFAKMCAFKQRKVSGVQAIFSYMFINF
jgi:hypothetical protein